MSGSRRIYHANGVQDPAIRRYLYLDLTVDELIDRMARLELNDAGNDKNVPFNASVRGYRGAVDSEGDLWLIKPIPSDEIVDHAFQEAAYYLDFALGTLAAPNLVKVIESRPYRVTKNIRNALQISSYEYFNEPFKSILANDLLNRWLFYDEDRNPNNYLVLHDSDRSPMIVVIDYNKADLRSTEMKITGNDTRFGWNRLEKTRFLTLLKPENFENLSLSIFEDRLTALAALTEERLQAIGLKTFHGNPFTAEQAVTYAELLARNIRARCDYIDAYFRRWFKMADESEQRIADDRYAGLGKSFMEYYKN